MVTRRYSPLGIPTIEDLYDAAEKQERAYREHVQRTIDDQAEADRIDEKKLAEWGIGSF